MWEFAEKPHSDKTVYQDLEKIVRSEEAKVSLRQLAAMHASELPRPSGASVPPGGALAIAQTNAELPRACQPKFWEALGVCCWGDGNAGSNSGSELDPGNSVYRA